MIPGTAAWLEGLLRERIGPGAAVGAITFAGRLLRIEGVRVPLGAAVEVDLTLVELELGAGLPLGALPLSARLATVQGTVRARGLAVPIDFTAVDGGEPSWASGRLRAGAPLHLEGTVELHPREGGGFVLALAITTPRSRVEIAGSVDASLTLHDARVTGRLATADLGWIEPALPDALLDLDLTAAGPLTDPRLRGLVFASEILLSRRGAALRLEGVSAEIDLDRRRLRYQRLAGSAHGARFGGWGRVPLAPPSSEAAAVPLLALQIEGAGAPLLTEIGALASARLRLPPDLTLTGELLLSAARAVSGSFAIETPRSALLFHLAVGASGELAGSTLRGRFAAADAVTVGIFGGPVRPRPDDVFGLDARLAGTLARPGLSGRLGAARVGLRIDRAGGASLPLEIEEASVLLDVDSEGLAWHRLAGRIHGGRFSSSGRLARAAGTLGATLEWSGVRVEAAGGALATVLRGASSGALRFERESLADHALEARGSVALDEPVYLFVRSFAPALERYRLPPLRARGGGPVRAGVHLQRGEIVVEPISASLDGIEVEGSVRLDREGRLLGRLAVHVLPAYLARSPILAIPAALSGKVTLPVHIGGTPSAPDLRTDALEILDGLIAGSRVGEAVKSALDGLWSAARPPRKPR